MNDRLIRYASFKVLLANERYAVTVPRVVADLVKPFAAHGLRLIAQIKLAAAVIIAANPSNIAELSTSMGHLRFVEGDICSHYVRCRKERFADLRQ